MSKYELKSFYDYYDALVEKWLDNIQRDNLIRNDAYFAAESNKKRNELVKLSSERLEIPEPYYGNPECCSAVIINLNPGTSGDEARKGYYKKLASQLSSGVKFSDFAKSFPCLEKEHPGFRFWSQKNVWIQRLCGCGCEHLRPFAVELCPYHSKKWNGTFINEEVRTHIQKWVLEPAFVAVKKSQLPFALAIGKGCYDEFKKLGFDELEGWDSTISDWPTNINNKPINRYFALLGKDSTKVLCTWCKGGTNSAPAKSFADIEKRILESIK